MPEKRSQAERLTIAETLLSGVWDEIERGNIDGNVLQLAVNTQIMCNRIVWKLNELNNKPADKRQATYDLLYEEGGVDQAVNMDRVRQTDFISDDRLAEIVRAEREGRLKINKFQMEKCCGNCLNFLQTPGKASGVCAKKSKIPKYYGEKPRPKLVYRSTQSCVKHFKPREGAT